MMSGEEKMNWIIFLSPAKAELFIVVLLSPRNQSYFSPAYVSSHVDNAGGETSPIRLIAVRETGVSQHQGGIIESPRTSQHYRIEGINYVKGNGNFLVAKMSAFCRSPRLLIWPGFIRACLAPCLFVGWRGGRYAEGRTIRTGTIRSNWGRLGWFRFG